MVDAAAAPLARMVLMVRELERVTVPVEDDATAVAVGAPDQSVATSWATQFELAGMRAV